MSFNYIEKENRPWGTFYVLQDDAVYKVKRIEVNSKQRLSYQSHKKRAEVWTIVEGNAEVILNGKGFLLKYGESIQIPLGAKHRITNSGNKKLIFIEVQTGSYFGEDDIIRYEDDYKRK